MSLIHFAMISRDDGKASIFSPDAKQSLLIDKVELQGVFAEIIKRGHAEIMPKNIIQGLGLGFGEMSNTGWKTLVSLVTKRTYSGALIE